MRELLLEIWASIRRNKLRTFLTGFSVAWGIFMLVILLGSGNGLKNGTLSNFGSMAVNSVIINGGWTSQPYKGYDKWRRINITNRDLEILRTEFPEVDKVSARVQGPGQYNLSHGRDFLNNAAVVGSDPEYREIMNVRVLDGRFLNDTDLRERRKVIVVDKNVRDVLFHGQSPVGQHLRHQQQRRQGRSVQRYERHRPRGVRQADLFRIRDGSSGRSVPLSAHINAQRGTKE